MAQVFYLFGSSAGGKSTLAAGVPERLVDCEYQFCVVDPEARARRGARVERSEDSLFRSPHQTTG